MRHTSSEKQENIEMVTRSEIGVKKPLKALGCTRARFTIGIKRMRITV